LLKRYLIGLYLEYGTTAGMEEATPQMKSAVLLQMLQHCAPSQSNTGKEDGCALEMFFSFHH
jgi:hypothetical protein